MVKDNTHKIKAKNQKMYDLTYVFEIGEANKDFLKTIIELFIQHTPIAIEEIKESFLIKDYETIRKTAHRIKPSINSLRIDSISDEIKALSKFDKEKMSDREIKKAIDKIDMVIREVVNELIQIKF